MRLTPAGVEPKSTASCPAEWPWLVGVASAVVPSVSRADGSDVTLAGRSGSSGLALSRIFAPEGSCFVLFRGLVLLKAVTEAFSLPSEDLGSLSEMGK